MPSQLVLCCGAKTWALIIGWIQTISSIFVAGVASFILRKNLARQINSNRDRPIYPDYLDGSEEYHDIYGSENDTGDEQINSEFHVKKFIKAYAVIILGTTIVTCLVYLVAGVMLIQSVKQANARKLKIWMIHQSCLFIVPFIVIILGFLKADFEIVFLGGILILVNSFCVWVVGVFRREVLGAGEGRVKYVSRI